MRVAEFLEAHEPGFGKQICEKWAGRAMTDDDEITVYEVHPIYIGYNGGVTFRGD
jgi:hypothetical protein